MNFVKSYFCKLNLKITFLFQSANCTFGPCLCRFRKGPNSMANGVLFVLGSFVASRGALFRRILVALGTRNCFLRCRTHPCCRHVMACLTLFSGLAAWFGCSWVGLGAPGRVWGVSGVLGGPGRVPGLSFFLLLCVPAWVSTISRGLSYCLRVYFVHSFLQGRISCISSELFHR